MIEGVSFVGGKAARGVGGFHGVEAASGCDLEPAFAEATEDMVREACRLADGAFDAFRNLAPEVRAGFLESIADEIEALGDPLIARAMQESGLPEARIRSERDRTTGQLRLFSALLGEREWLDAVVEPANTDRRPSPRPALARRNVPVGPVAVFAASNFPLAFSTAGGDTASALAAGCPVVVKAHPAHPGTSELVARAVLRACMRCGMPEGTFSVLQGQSHALGAALVTDHAIKAVGFTGSRAGGLALSALAAARPQPIPVFAEMSSINPVLFFPDALASAPEKLADGFMASLTLGAGQFCTNPGLILAVEGPSLDRFLNRIASILPSYAGASMLTPNIHGLYMQGLERRDAHPGLRNVAKGVAVEKFSGPAAVYETECKTFLADEALSDEVFGACATVVRCQSLEDMRTVMEALEGQLTITLHLGGDDVKEARAMLPLIERRAGRILSNGWPTGVEVSRAMVHGGPFPATSDGRSTSVGTAAIFRFLRPICYQDFPDELLPAPLHSLKP